MLARKLKFSSYVHLPSINKIIQYRYALVILCSVGEVIIFKHGRYIKQFIFTPSMLNTIYKYGHNWVI